MPDYIGKLGAQMLGEDLAKLTALQARSKSFEKDYWKFAKFIFLRTLPGALFFSNKM